MKTVLITGAAGFIGTHLTQLLTAKYKVIAQDNLSNQDSLKRKHLNTHLQDVSIHNTFISCLKTKPDAVIHLAAETGISGSLMHPQRYFHQNVEGTFNVLEECRKNGVKYLIYASSSSVYEPNEFMIEEAPHNNQLSFYGTSKRMAELMIENYCRQYGMVAIGLRFFTVYGSWTRPDMAAYKFMEAISNDQSVTLYNQGEVYRDFTHVSDIVKSIELLIEKIGAEPIGKHLIFNIGGGNPVSVKTYASLIANKLEKPLKIEYKDLPVNELSTTKSDNLKLEQYIGYKPNCCIEDGIAEMVNWFNTINTSEVTKV